MRVLHVHKVNGIGGSERHLLSLLPGLITAGLDVRLCVVGRRGVTGFPPSARGAPHPALAGHGRTRPQPRAGPLAVARAARVSPGSRPHAPHPRRSPRATRRPPRRDPRSFVGPRHPRLLRTAAVPKRGDDRGTLGPPDDRDLKPRPALPRATSHHAPRRRPQGPLRNRRRAVAQRGVRTRSGARRPRPGSRGDRDRRRVATGST